MKLLFPDKKGWFIAASLTFACLVFSTWVYLSQHAHHATDITDIAHGGGASLNFLSVPGVWSLFGFVSCALIIIISKALGKVFLQKPEDWYD